MLRNDGPASSAYGHICETRLPKATVEPATLAPLAVVNVAGAGQVLVQQRSL